MTLTARTIRTGRLGRLASAAVTAVCLVTACGHAASKSASSAAGGSPPSTSSSATSGSSGSSPAKSPTTTATTPTAPASPTGSSAAASHSPSASASAPKSKPSTSPQPRRTTGPAGPPSTPPPQASAPPSPPGADPAHIPDRAWLPAPLLPLAATDHWTWSATPDSPFSGYVCGHQTLDRLGAHNVVVRNASPGSAGAAPGGEFVADQRLYFFADASSAQAAMRTITQDVTACAVPAGLAPPAPGTHTTANGEHALAVAVYPTPNPANEYGALREIHAYLAQRGSVITVVTLTTGTFDGAPNQTYLTTVDDRAVLTAVTDHLSAFGTS